MAVLSIQYMVLSAFLLSLLSCGAIDKPQSLKGLYEDLPIGEVDGVPLSINIAFPDKNPVKPRPVLVMIHGGGFVSGDKSSKNTQIVKLSKLGFVAASAMYRLSPEYKFPAAVDDIKVAIRYLKANAEKYHIDPERIIVTGASAGGYLAVMVGVTGNSDAFSDYGLYSGVDSSVHAVAAQSAPVGDFSLEKYNDSPMLTRLAGGDTAGLSAVRVAMSPVTYLDSSDPPFFLSHGDSDPLVPVDMTREFVRELDKQGHDVEYYEVKGGDHSLNKSAPEGAKFVFRKYLAFLAKWAQ